MTQPTFVPIAEADQVRPARHLHVPGPWTTSRPAELIVPDHAPRAPTSGRRGPTRASRSAWRNASSTSSSWARASRSTMCCSASALVASKRAALFGRAPCIYDVRLALDLWGFLDDAPADVRAARRAAFSSISHDYVAQRALVDSVPEETLRLSPDEAARGAVPPPRRGARHVVDAIGAIDRLEIEAGGLHLHRPRLWSARRPPDPAPARLPADLVGLARRAVGAGAGGVPRRCARPARLLHGRPPGRGGRLRDRAPPGRRPRPGRLHGDGDVRPRGARLGRHAGLDRGLAPSGSGPLAQRRVDPAPAGAAGRAARYATRPRRPTARPRTPSARPRCRSGCCSAPTAGAAAWPRSWPRPVSTTTTPGCTSPR